MNKFPPFFCHKVLPLVYDDSLSYYEVICKLVAKTNEVVDEMTKLEKAYEEILSYYENIRQEINEIIEEKFAIEDAKIDAKLAEMQEQLDAEIASVYARLSQVVDEIDRLTNLVNTFYENSKTYTDSQIAIERARIDGVVNDVVIKLEREIEELREEIRHGLEMIQIYDPTSGSEDTIENVIKHVYDNARVDEGLTVSEYNAYGLTVGEYEAFNMRVKDYDMIAKKIINRFYKWFYNPLTGIKNTVENLCSWNMTEYFGTLTCAEYDDLALTVDDYDALNYTVEDYTKLTNRAGRLDLSGNGLTVAQYESIGIVD